jgi:hypothetical protein
MLLSRLIRSVWMMRVFHFGMSIVMSVLPLLWASRRKLLVLTAFHLSFFIIAFYCLLSLINHVLHVFNHAFTCSVFPTMWKRVIVRPVARATSPSCPSDFCPITIASVLSKGFEQLINDQILGHVDRSGLLSEFQSGFRCGHGTSTALVRVIEDLKSSMTEWKMTVLLNFSKAFD